VISRRTFVVTTASALGVVPHLRIGRRSRFEPWLEIDRAALAANVREVSRLAGGRSLLAVVKNNAYGLGLREAGPVFAAQPEVAALAVVKPEEALALRDAGVTKPVLLMGRAADDVQTELVARDVRLAVFWDEAPRDLSRLAERLGRPVPIHLYIDTGMNRLGMPHARALQWITALARERDLVVEGTFTELAETDFDGTQLARFVDLTTRARAGGAPLGRLHAASSHALFFRDDAALDLVRPGLALYGAYPAGAARARAALQPAFRLRARVLRVERLAAGEAVSYGRSYVAREPTWIATLPAGHTDGYPRGAVKGCEILIAGRTYRVIGAVSAGHMIVEVGPQKTVEVGDVATLVGPDHPAIHPNTVAERAQVSVYDVLMHLNPILPRLASPTD
jgi:alanine racemase